MVRRTTARGFTGRIFTLALITILIHSLAVPSNSFASTPTWSTFSSGVNGDVYAVASSQIYTYVGGNFSSAGGVATNKVALWNMKTETWSALGSGIQNGVVYAIAILGDDVYVGGSFTLAGGVTANRIAKWNRSTGTWSALGTGIGDGGVYAIAILGGDVYIGGSFTLAGGVTANRIAKWDGSTWSTLGDGFNDDVNAISITASGSNIYVGGKFTASSSLSNTYSRIANWNGSTWSALGSGLNQEVKAIAVALITGDVYVGGNFTQAGGSPANYIARWRGGVTWDPVGPGTNNYVTSLSSFGDDVYAGGNFTVAGGISANRIAKVNRSTWSAVGNGFNDNVRAIDVSGGIIHAGGNFTIADSSSANRISNFDTGVCYVVNDSGLIVLTDDCINQITIDGPTSINYRAFNANRNITSVTIGNSVTSIGDEAFEGNSELVSIVFRGDAPTVGSGAFNPIGTSPKAYIYQGASGFSEIGSEWNGLTLANALPKPEINVTPTGASGASLKVSTRLNIASGETITGFDYSIDGGSTFTSASAFSLSGNEYSFDIGPLTLGQSYSVQTRAKNSFGMGPSSDSVIASTLKPVTIPTYRINFHSNTSDSVSLAHLFESYASGTSIKLPSRVPLRTGYSFVAWNTKVDGSGASYLPSDIFTFGDADTALYAMWRINRYTLAYNANGGPKLGLDSLTNSYLSSTKVADLPAPSQRTGYTFNGWNDNPSGTGKTFRPGDSFVFGDSDTTLYAQWKLNSYRLSFDGNGQSVGRVPVVTQNFFSSTFSLPAPSQVFTKRGYVFSGWNTKSDASGINYAVGESIKIPASDLILYANWKAKNYKVTFYLSDGKTIIDYFATDGIISTPPSVPTRDGFEFRGWSASPTKQSLISFPYKPGVKRPISIFAVWEKRSR